MDRFIWQTWPGLETALFLERKPVIPKLQLEDEVPSHSVSFKADVYFQPASTR